MLRYVAVACLLGCLITGLSACTHLSRKSIYRVGLPIKVSTMAPYFYQQYLTAPMKTSIMPLNDARQLKTALLVEAVDLAVLPVSLVLAEQQETGQIKILAPIARSAEPHDSQSTFLVLAAKQTVIDKHRADLTTILMAHQQASSYLNQHPQAWLDQAVKLKMERSIVNDQMKSMILMTELDQNAKQSIKARGQYLVESKQLEQVPDYELLWQQPN